MTLELLYWILLLIVLVLGGAPIVRNKDWSGAGMGLIVWLLFFVIGWSVFGAPIRGH